MKILVTGGAGFIGSHVVDAYIRDGHQVVVVDDLSNGKKENINSKAHFIQMSILDEKLEDVFHKHQFDMVNHHAAQIDVRISVNDPQKDARINVLGLINVLENCRKYMIKKIIFSASGGTYYGECTENAPDENQKPYPMSPYGINKMISEYYIRYYSTSFGLGYVILRYGNVYGPRQDPQGEAGVIAIFCGKMLKDEDVFIYGDGLQERDYVFVEDVSAANINALARGTNSVYNIGTGRSATVIELYEIIKKYSNKNSKSIFKPQRTGELRRSALNIAKAEKELGWKANVSLHEGLKRTYDYFKQKNSGVLLDS